MTKELWTQKSMHVGVECGQETAYAKGSWPVGPGAEWIGDDIVTEGSGCLGAEFLFNRMEKC